MTILSIIIPVFATIGFVVASEMIPQGGLFLMITIGLCATASVFLGMRLPFFLRLFVTLVTFYFGYATCILGRTTSPHLDFETLQWSLYTFALLSIVPSLALLRIWIGKVRVAVIASVLPFSLAAACAVAAYEEQKFVKDHPRGVGPTPRWTVSNHWLAYDAENHRLDGSD